MSLGSLLQAASLEMYSWEEEWERVLEIKLEDMVVSSLRVHNPSQ